MTYKYTGGKLRRWEKLSKSEQADLLFDLLNALVILKTLPEMASFLTDLLTSDEVKFISKRLRIAKLLLSGWKYRDIELKLKVSQSTVAKVATWIKEKGSGFRCVISKLPQRRSITPKDSPTALGMYKGVDVDKILGSMFDGGGNYLAKKEEENLNSTLEDLSSKDVVRHRVDEYYNGEFPPKRRHQKKEN